MDLSIIYTKTGRGARALVKKLPAHAGQILSVIDGQLSAEVIFSQLKKMDMDEFEEGITWLVEGGFIKMVLKNPFPSSIWAPISKNAIQVSEISIDEFQDAQQTTTKTSGFASDTANNDTITTQTPSSPAKRELDESSAAIIENLIQADNEARERAEAQLKAQNSLSDAETESRNKAEQEARERAEAEARAKAAEEARLKAEAEIKARHDEEAKARAEQEARERAEAETRTKAAEEARLKAEAAAKARIEAEAKAQAEKAAKAKAEQEAKARAEQEARERAEAEAQAKAAEEARLKAEAEAAAKAAEEARIKAEQEAKARAEEEARIQAEKTAKAKAEQEARERAEEARLKAEAEAAAKVAEESRIKAEEEAKARAEQEARAEEARLKAEAEAEAKAQAEREAWEKAEAEAKAKAEAKAERKARQKAEAKAKAEAEARAKAEAEVEAKTLAVQNALAEAEAAKKALAQATHRSSVIENDLIDFEEVLLPNKPATPAWKTGLTRVFNACSHKLAQISEKYQRINFRKIQRRLMPYWTAGFNIVSALFRKGSVVAIALFVIAAIAALFVNLRPLITPIESIATANLHEPVKIESIHAFVLPTPHFSLNNVKVGPFSKTIDFQTVQIYFSPLNLKEKLLNHTETPYLLKSIKIEGANFKQDDWGRPVEWLAHFGKTKELQLDEIQLKNISLRMTETDMMNVNGAMLFKNNLLDNATLTNQDKNLEIKATRNPDSNNYQLAIKARSWRTPVNPNILFFELDANGTLDSNMLTLSPITGQAYDGDVKANLSINLPNGNISGDYVLEKMNLTDLAMDLKLNSIIDGAFSMHANFAVDMDKTSHQLRSPKVNGHFSIANGAIHKIDITEAMRSGNLGGTTHFTSLEGEVSLDNQDYQFTNLLLRDNQLEANGNLQISAQNSVTAIVNSKILVKTNPIKARLNIIGNVNNLSLKK